MAAAKKRVARAPKTVKLGKVETAVAYSRGVAKHIKRKHPKKLGFAAGVAAALAALEVLA